MSTEPATPPRVGIGLAGGFLPPLVALAIAAVVGAGA